MKECKLYHTGMLTTENGMLQDNHVFLVGVSGELLLPEEIWCAKVDCANRLIQFEVDGKWGFADISTGEIKIQPQWDFAGPFYGKYAHVANGVQVTIDWNSCGVPQFSGEGKHGYIDANGNPIIPLIYEDAKDYPGNTDYREGTYLFSVRKDKKWGLVDRQNKTIIPFSFLEINGTVNSNFYITAIENHKGIGYGVYNLNYEELIPPVLDQPPQSVHFSKSPEVFINHESLTYYYVKTGRRFGVISSDGRMITDLTLLKKDAVALIKKLSGY